MNVEEGTNTFSKATYVGCVLPILNINQYDTYVAVPLLKTGKTGESDRCPGRK